MKSFLMSLSSAVMLFWGFFGGVGGIHSEGADNKTCLANSNNFPWVLRLSNRARKKKTLISSPVSLCGALIYLIYMINIPNAIPIILLISAYFMQPLAPVAFD